MSCVSWVTDKLRSAGVPYQVTQHSLSYTAQEMAQQEGVSGNHVAKTVGVSVGGKPFLLVLPASRKISMHRLRELTGDSHARLLSEGEIAFLFPDCDVGAIPPLRHWSEIEIWMDKSLKGSQEILFPAGTHDSSVRMPFGDWKTIVNPREVDISESLECAELQPETIRGVI